ncbi:hypothetical protein Tco_0575268 [Tanacetum coccineum]
MGDENPIRTLGDYSKPSHEGYRNTIELPVGNNVVPLRSDTIRLVQNGCSFYRLRSEDPNQHLKDFLKLVDSLDLDDENRERTRLQDLALYDNESWNDPRDFAKPVKAIALPQDVSNTFDRRLIELENQVQCLMEAHLALTQTLSVNKSLPITICIQLFMASQDARLSKFEADFKQQQNEMTNKIDTVLKAITRIAGALPSDTIKNPKLSTSLVLSARSYPTMDPQCSTMSMVRSMPSQSIPSNKATPMTTELKRMRKKRRQPGKYIVKLTRHPIHQVLFITKKVLKLN